jgi:hypothetical protein
MTAYKKASDSVKREEIWEGMEKLGTAANSLRKVENAYKRTINCVKTNKERSARFETISGETRKHIITDVV